MLVRPSWRNTLIARLLAEVTEPHAGPGQVRVRIVAAAVNPIDFRIRRGWVQEMMGPVSFPAVPGMEAAGIVDELGEGVTGVSVGDEVMAWTETGAYAEYALASGCGRPASTRRSRGTSTFPQLSASYIAPCPRRY